MTFCLSPPQKSREFFFKKVKQRQQGTGATQMEIIYQAANFNHKWGNNSSSSTKTTDGLHFEIPDRFNHFF